MLGTKLQGSDDQAMQQGTLKVTHGDSVVVILPTVPHLTGVPCSLKNLVWQYHSFSCVLYPSLMLPCQPWGDRG